MICIGVTGGIGSGKSVVCEIFQKKNIPIFFSDAIASNILTTNKSAQKEILSNFGNEILGDTAGIIDRRKLAKIVFQDPQKLAILNSIIHPIVFEELSGWKNALKQSSPYCMAESALLFESGMDEFVDYVLAVRADDEVRIRRTIERTKMQKEEVLSRMQNQMPPEEIKELSDFEITNNGTLEDLSKKVDFFHIIFSTLKQRRELE